MSTLPKELRIFKFGFNELSDEEIQMVLEHFGVTVVAGQIDLHDNWSTSFYRRSSDSMERWDTGSLWYVAGYFASSIGANVIIVETERPKDADLNNFIEGFGGDLSAQFFRGLFTADDLTKISRVLI